MEDNQQDKTEEELKEEPLGEASTEESKTNASVDAADQDGAAVSDALPVFPAYASGLNPNKLRVIVKALKACEQNINNVVRLMEKELSATGAGATPSSITTATGEGSNMAPSFDMNANREMEIAGVKAATDGRVVEGVFDGQNMVGSDGKIYSVPPNYASKSKLVEGDMLKLTITPAGSFIYKQIGPTDRARIVASLGFDQTVGEYYATHETRRWNILKASVTYFKGEPDDEIVVLVPKSGPSKWAAVENIIKKVPVI